MKMLFKSVAERGEDYLRDVLSLGVRSGQFVEISPTNYRALRLKYTPGFGDRVASFAKPIARMIDGVLGTDLENCDGCAKRQALLNELTEPKG